MNAVRALGGLSAIAISHPHFYASMVEWSRAFEGVPVYVHAADRGWVMRPDPAIVFWEGDTHRMFEGLTLIHCGGHFKGSAVLHWAVDAEDRGILLSGDTLQVAFDRRHVSFMYSYPNLIPLGAPTVHRIVEAVTRFPFDRIYGGWFNRAITRDAKAALARSAGRYIHAITASEGESAHPQVVGGQ